MCANTQQLYYESYYVLNIILCIYLCHSLTLDAFVNAIIPQGQHSKHATTDLLM